MTRLRGVLVGLVLWFGFTGRALAAEVHLFTDPAAFAAAAGGDLTPIDFEGEEQQAATLTYPCVTFSSLEGTDQDLYIVSPATYSPLTSNVLVSNRNFNPLIATFTEPTAGAAAELYSLVGGSTLTVSVHTSDGTTEHVVPVTPDVPTFFGVLVKGATLEQLVVTPEFGAFAGVDHFVCVPPAPEDPVGSALEALFAAVEAGVRDGSIALRDRGLAARLAVLRRAWEAGDYEQMAGVLHSLVPYVRARIGRGIAPATGNDLLELIAAALSAVEGVRRLG